MLQAARRSPFVTSIRSHVYYGRARPRRRGFPDASQLLPYAWPFKLGTCYLRARKLARTGLAKAVPCLQSGACIWTRFTTCASVRWRGRVPFASCASGSREVAGLSGSNDLRGRMRSLGETLPSHEGAYTRQRHICHGGIRQIGEACTQCCRLSDRLLLLCNDRLVRLSRSTTLASSCGRRFNRATFTYRRPFSDQVTAGADRPPGGQGSEARTCASGR